MKVKEIQEQGNVNLKLQNKKKQKIKEKGITLIALVVTIIILLILVGVAISQISGENGLIKRAKEAVEKYKEEAEKEQIQLGELEQYVSDFSIVGGEEEEGEKALVEIKGFEVTGDVVERQITVKVTTRGETTGIEYKINTEEEWIKGEEGKKVGEETEYSHTFETLTLGKSYYIRVKVYDVNSKYKEAISEIVTLSYEMTAEERDVLIDKTYLTGDGTLRTGTMPNNGEVTQTLNAGEEYKIKQGYYSGGTITAKLLGDQTSGDAVAGEILSGKKAWVNGALVTGEMTDNGKVTQTLDAGQSYKIAKGYHNGEGTVTAKTLEEQTRGTAGASDILSGQTAYVNGKSVTGNMKNNGGKTVDTSGTTSDSNHIMLKVPETGYYNQNSMIQALKSDIKSKFYSNITNHYLESWGGLSSGESYTAGHSNKYFLAVTVNKDMSPQAKNFSLTVTGADGITKVWDDSRIEVWYGSNLKTRRNEIDF